MSVVFSILVVAVCSIYIFSAFQGISVDTNLQLKATVIYSNPYSGTDCGLFSCSSVPKDNVTFALSNGQNTSQVFGCTAFKVGQVYGAEVLTSASDVGDQLIITTTIAMPNNWTNYSYTILNLPSGC